MRPIHRFAIAAAALAALAVAAPAASADSIAYIKDGNVWLATPDGSRLVQITQSGGYSDVSQADDGTMIALNGVRLHRLDRRGAVLADFDTPVSDTRPPGAKVFHGPFDPAISPDGTKVAYTYYYLTQTQDPTCFPPQCAVAINEGGTGYSWADRQTGWDEPGLGRHSGWRHPVWLDDDNLMLSNPTHLPNHDVILDTVSDGGTGNLVKNWFSDSVEGNAHVSGGDITRDRTKMAFQTGVDDATLTIYAVPSFPTAFRDGVADPSTYPHVCYRYSGADGGRYSQPTFSPDGGRLAWSEASGIKIADVPSFAGGCTTDGATPTPPLVIPGGSEPDWGPADVPAAAPAPTPAPGPAAEDGAGNGPKAALKRAKLRAALRRGLKVTVTLPSDGRLAVTVKRGRRVVARSGPRTVKAGRRTVTVKFTKAARRSLRRARSAKLAIRVAYMPTGAPTQVTALRATLRR